MSGRPKVSTQRRPFCENTIQAGYPCWKSKGHDGPCRDRLGREFNRKGWESAAAAIEGYKATGSVIAPAQRKPQQDSLGQIRGWVDRQRESEDSADPQFDLGYRCAVERVAELLGMETHDPRR